MDLEEAYIYEWLDGVDDNTLEKKYAKMEKLNIPFDPYLPLNEEQKRILLGLPIFRPLGSYPNHRDDRDLASIKHPVVNIRRLKQTTIDRFFKPVKRESLKKRVNILNKREIG